MQKLKTIIVDDFQIYRKSLKMVLSRSPELENIEIEEASNGFEFLKIIENKQPSLVLMDIKMPGMTGLEATKLAIKKYPKIKVIAISTLDDYKLIQDIEKAGAKAFMVKGFDKHMLVAVILKVLANNKQFITKL
ncbi:MAG: hypothetical protein DRJ05_08785 [Bacteroidetes bacterium]|nr:MAG: hypothetical protein DRJ05_08785 [Bacteroidota bacterium]